jgi:hypothetical protein
MKNRPLWERKESKTDKNRPTRNGDGASDIIIIFYALYNIIITIHTYRSSYYYYFLQVDTHILSTARSVSQQYIRIYDYQNNLLSFEMRVHKRRSHYDRASTYAPSTAR